MGSKAYREFTTMLSCLKAFVGVCIRCSGGKCHRQDVQFTEGPSIDDCIIVFVFSKKGAL